MDVQEEKQNPEEEIGPLLRRLRGQIGLREAGRRTGISSSYLSQLERGERRPGPNVLRRLASLYGVEVHQLLKAAGFMDDPNLPPRKDDPREVERAYRYVLEDPRFQVGTRPSGPMSVETKRFIVEMYEQFTGKRILE